MAAAQDLWAAVVGSYDADILTQLTNVRDPSATASNTARGESAAEAVIALWPVWAQTDYDASNATHVEIGKRGVIAMLCARGGVAPEAARVEWGEVFGPSGMLARLQATGPRGRMSPSTNSQLEPSQETRFGSPVLPWSDPRSFARGVLPSRRLSDPYWDDEP
jgi:hypothetical protein